MLPYAHLDADSFFASVIVRSHPQYEGKPLLALGMGGGCVIAATYEAKAQGVKTGMRLSEARSLVPGAIEACADFGETLEASREIEAIIRDHGAIVEQMSIDEWFIDLRSCVGGSPVNEQKWAEDIQEEIYKKTHLWMSVGVAETITLAKMASEKKKPRGITVVKMNNREIFLKNRPIGAIPGIGRARLPRVQEYGWKTAWDFVQGNDVRRHEICGRVGEELRQELSGESIYKISNRIEPPQSISRCRSFQRTRSKDLVKAHILKHLEYCTMKMRREGLSCKEISIWIRDGEYQHRGRHWKLETTSETVEAMLPSITKAIDELIRRTDICTQAGLALLKLTSASMLQPSLFEDRTKGVHDLNIQKAMDALHERFGRDSITRGSALAVRSGVKRRVWTMETEGKSL